jgi:hypothetical protein
MTTVEIGRIVRLQVQSSSLKAGEARARYYDPAPLLSVQRFEAAAEGVTVQGPEGVLLDVHHARHPQTKNRTLTNSVSVGFTSHYARMRARFGAHLTDGIAGENILVETVRDLDPGDVERGFLVEGSDGRRVILGSVGVAHPCVEFSRFALEDRQAAPLVVSEVLRFLDNGVRGYYALVDSSSPMRVELGDCVSLIEA